MFFFFFFFNLMKEHCNNKADFFFLYMRPVGKGTHSDFSSTSSLQNGSTGLLDRALSWARSMQGVRSGTGPLPAGAPCFPEPSGHGRLRYTLTTPCACLGGDPPDNTESSCVHCSLTRPEAPKSSVNGSLLGSSVLWTLMDLTY